MRPDVGIWQPQPPSGDLGGVALITATPVESLVQMELPLRLYTVEVRETGTLRLVTAIEVLSPVNKRSSHEAYHDYLRKRRQLLHSEAHVIEIDLLRGGERPPLAGPVPSAPYYGDPQSCAPSSRRRRVAHPVMGETARAPRATARP